MIAVLDASVLCQDLRLVGNPARVFLSSAHVVPAEIVIPVVVLDEVTNTFRERLVTALADVSKAQGAVTKLTPNFSASQLTLDADQEARIYREFLEKKLAEVGGRTLPYPKVSHEKLVQRALQRKKPFKIDGSGYRDALIWESVRSLTWSGTERVAFLTNNTKDFGEGPGLHVVLADEIMNPGRIELFSSLRAFNDKHVIPRLEIVDRFHQELAGTAGGKPAVAEWIRRNLIGILRQEELGPVIAPLPHVGSFFASELVSFDDIRASAVRRLDSGELLCTVVVKASVEVSISIDDEEYETYHELRRWAGGPGTWSEVVGLLVSLELVVDSTATVVLSDEVTLVEQA